MCGRLEKEREVEKAETEKENEPKRIEGEGKKKIREEK